MQTILANEEALKDFAATGKGFMYTVLQSVYGWCVRYRTGWNDTVSLSTHSKTEEAKQECIEYALRMAGNRGGVVLSEIEKKEAIANA